MTRRFNPQRREEELAILRSDTPDFQQAQAYLAPLIEDALSLFLFCETDYCSLREEVRSMVPIAARRFLQNPENVTAGYTFSTYFTWYLSQAIDTHFHIRRAA